VNSADAWYEDEETRNADDLEALLGLSVELVDTMNSAQREVVMEIEAAKHRHPAGKGLTVSAGPPGTDTPSALNAADRCDSGCGAGALYRVAAGSSVSVLDFCHHHFGRFFPALEGEGWRIIAHNGSLLKELYANRLKGDDHA
jgi:hypothetical protein